jgi:hypothetical protein
MMPSLFSRRRILLRALAGTILVSTPLFSFGQAKNDGTSDKSGADKGDGKAKDEKKGGKSAGKTGAGAVLTVVVTGNGKPVAQAEVKVKFPPGVGGEATLPTNPAGEAIFNSAGTGTATVRVIVTGWESVLKEVVLKQGPQLLTIKLNALPGAK